MPGFWGCSCCIDDFYPCGLNTGGAFIDGYQMSAKNESVRWTAPHPGTGTTAFMPDCCAGNGVLYGIAVYGITSPLVAEGNSVAKFSLANGAILDSFSTGLLRLRRGLALCNDGNFIACGAVSISTGNVRKIDGTGALIWQFSDGPTNMTFTKTCVDSDDNVFAVQFTAVPGDESGVKLFALDPDGNLRWSVTHGADLRGVCTDPSSNVYICGRPAAGVTLRKIDSSGAETWSKSSGERLFGVAIDRDANVYASGLRYLTSYQSDGTLRWTYDTGSNATEDSEGAGSVSVTRKGQVVRIENRNPNSIIRVLDTDGNLIATQTITGGLRLYALDIEGGRLGAFGV